MPVYAHRLLSREPVLTWCEGGTRERIPVPGAGTRWRHGYRRAAIQPLHWLAQVQRARHLPVTVGRVPGMIGLCRAERELKGFLPA
jgi:hypothetical protein